MQQKYAQYVGICKNMHAKICKNMDSICKNLQQKFAKYAVKYAKYAEVHILHILHIYALPTLLMEASNSIKPKIASAAHS